MNFVFLDVDGTIVAVADDIPGRVTGWDEWQEIPMKFLIWSKELVQELKELSERPDVTVIWHTDRRVEVLEFAKIVGLPEFDFITASDDDIRTVVPWWKLPHVKEAWESNPDAKIIWLDDNIPFDDESRIWCEGRERLLTVSPHFHFALSRNDMQSVRDFIDS